MPHNFTLPLSASATVIDFRPRLERRSRTAAAVSALAAGTSEPATATLSRQLAEAERVIDEQRRRIAQLESLSMTDELTGLLNRRGFLGLFRRELAAVQRNARPGGVLLMIDLDGFKAVNDTHGHAAGDAHLRHVARLLEGAVRGGQDVVGRLAGDEFAILLTAIDAETGFARATVLAEAINGRMTDWQGTPIAVRFSVGVMAYGRDSDEGEVMAAADRALYARKADQVRRRQGA